MNRYIILAAVLAFLTAPAFAQMPSSCHPGACGDFPEREIQPNGSSFPSDDGDQYTAPDHYDIVQGYADNSTTYAFKLIKSETFVVMGADGPTFIPLGEDCPGDTHFVLDINSDQMKFRICTKLAKETTIESNPYLFQGH